jgi:putative hemolysin
VIALPTVIAVGLVCVVFEAFFSGSEIAMVSADRTRLRQRAQAGDRAARLTEAFLEKPQVLLATTLMGTNLATVTFSVTVALALLSHAGTESEFLAILFVTPFTLILGEAVPKTLFQQYADTLVPKIVYPLRVAMIVLRPAVLAMSGVATAMTRLFRTEEGRAFITREELSFLIETEPTTTSEITPDEREMIQKVFDFSETSVADVMVPLSEVMALAGDTRIRDATLEIVDKQHSRIPVYRSRLDDIVGVLHVFDLLRAGRGALDKTVSELARAATYVPETKLAVDLLVELQAAGAHMAVVVDEYGGAVGIVTMEDILEEIVGEIEDEHDEPAPIRQERPGVWRVAGRMAVARINEELKLDLPESDEYESIAGLILDQMKRIPSVGESLTAGYATIEITAASDRAVDEVRVSRRRKR